MLELYFFNKEAPSKNGLSYWEANETDNVQTQLNFNLDRFKARENNDTLLSEFAQELTYHFRENEKLKPYFSELKSKQIQIQLIQNYHHVFCFDSDNFVLKLDAAIENKFMPLYLFAVYYSLARTNKSPNQIFRQMFEFLQLFDFRSIKTILDRLVEDKKSSRVFDAGSHLQSYLKQVYQIQTQEAEDLDFKAKYRLTQLLRNRSLVGKMPFDLDRFINISGKYDHDAFSGEANDEYFQSLQQSFDKEFAKLYYEHLTTSLHNIGFRVVAQRGSRVAHEQGPILINAEINTVDEEFLVDVKKFQASMKDALAKITNSCKLLDDSCVELKDLARMLVKRQSQEFNIIFDNLLYLCEQNNFKQARFIKELLNLKKAITAMVHELDLKVEDLFVNKKHLDKANSQNINEQLKTLQETFTRNFYELNEKLQDSFARNANAVVYVQRPSVRSGHFIPRIVLGQKLYVETDSESEEQRLDAMPFNFVVPDFDFIAGGTDSFFENASISIVTDQATGEPNIKWENAEDLAKSMAPGIYQAIKAANTRGKNFHYQIETTLFGPLIELFVAILENEMNFIASIDRAGKDTCKDLIAGYREEIKTAAKFVFELYLLENNLLGLEEEQNLDYDEEFKETLLSMRDVQVDVAAYALQLRSNPDFAEQIQTKYQSLKQSHAEDYAEVIKQIQVELHQGLNKFAIRQFIKKYIRYPESTARKEFLEQNQSTQKITVSADARLDADYRYHLSVAPSRIDFGKDVVASVTTLMGRMIGADNPEALQVAKEYIDYVSKTNNGIFGSSAEAGSVKVIENTCRAVQYAKAISFQGVFQSFNIDGALARMVINSRDTREAGLHVMEFGTMASTGYCITKEPLFILLGLALNTDVLFDKLEIKNPEVRNELKALFRKILASRSNFATELDWQINAYEEMIDSDLVQKFLSDPEYKWLPNIKTMIVLLKYVSDSDEDSVLAHSYSSLASKLIELSRVVNETGIIQRTQLMNSAIKKAKLLSGNNKDYSDLRIAMNASYKGNVSDERENANQYLIALLLQQKQYLKNTNMPEVAKLIEGQIANYSLPKEIRVFDPYVDPDVFMSGELKNIAENFVTAIMSIDLNPALTRETIEACLVTYGSDLKDWPLIKQRMQNIDELKQYAAAAKYAELYYKGFFKDPQQAYQALDVIQLNSSHDELKLLFQNLVELRDLMRINNPDSLLVLVDNPQQAKVPLLDFDKVREWLALGGVVTSHMISASVYDRWLEEVKQEKEWAKQFLQKFIFEDSLSAEELSSNQDYQTLSEDLSDSFAKLKSMLELKRDLLLQKFYEAKDMAVDIKTLTRYSEQIHALSQIAKYEKITDINFADWLILGGRWVLNGQKQKDIDYVVKLFDNSKLLGNITNRGFEVFKLFVTAAKSLQIARVERVTDIAGSTKEADLLVTDAAEGLNFRIRENKVLAFVNLRNKEMLTYEAKLRSYRTNVPELINNANKFIEDYYSLQASSGDRAEMHRVFARLLKILEAMAESFESYLPEIKTLVHDFTHQSFVDERSLQPFFGDHRKDKGAFSLLAEKIAAEDSSQNQLDNLIKFGELLNNAFLIFLTIDIDDENEMINKLGIFFDQYLNVHEEDYPPYMFHGLCAGASFGFNQTYFYDTNLRAKMFKLACSAGMTTYKLLHDLISSKTVLQNSSQEYRDALIGDYENGLIPVCYQHETICIEERLWDCMRALRNFVRNYHDRHPLPVIIKNEDAKVEKLFRYELDDDVELCWVAGISNPGKHSWDLNCVFRSPMLRRRVQVESGVKYIPISCFTPFLTGDGEIKQIYTAFEPELIENQRLNFLTPYSKEFLGEPAFGEKRKAADGFYALNNEGFVHAMVVLEGKLPKPHVTMSAHTHPQYISNFVRDLGVPEVWSLLSMQQMYAKTVLPQILEAIGMQGLAQVNFYQKEFADKREAGITLEQRLKNRSYDHIDFWILKGSKDSGGRGISGKLSLSQDRQEIIDFIFERTQTDDVVMQEFVPNNARSFINHAFLEEIIEAFTVSGIAINQTTPYEQLFFAMRSFQSFSGIKGYLYSVNIGNVTVNAGQGAKLFYGEPLYIMPIYIAGKVQKLLDEQGELLLKQAIPAHAKSFAKENNLPITPNSIGADNSYMLNGLFDYIPYVYVLRESKDSKLKEFKVIAEDNSYGGIDYFYSYYGDKVMLASGEDHQSSVDALEKVLKDFANEDWQGPEKEIDLNLAKIELNSGLGQANLLQKAIEAKAPQNKDLFLEWTEDLGKVAASVVILEHSERTQ